MYGAPGPFVEWCLTKISLYYIVLLWWLLLQLDFRTPSGFDRTRNAEIGNKNIKLHYLEEAYTTEHWLVRIYRVKKYANRFQEFDDAVKRRARKTAPKKVRFVYFWGWGKCAFFCTKKIVFHFDE